MLKSQLAMFSEARSPLIIPLNYPDMKLFRRKLCLMFTFVFFSLIFILNIHSKGFNKDDNFNTEHLVKQKLDDCYNMRRSIFIPDLPVIYAITPTYARPAQKAELTRLSHTFMLVPNFHWIIVEDAETETALVSGLLQRSGINHTHLIAPTPKQWKLKEKDPKWKKPRGVLQRNEALAWLRDNLNADKHKGVVYFADDDNTYSLEIFEEMRKTHGVSVWPVGLVGGLMVEKPIINTTSGRVIGWNSSWRPERPFPIDMAGFAINLGLLLRHRDARFSFNVERGFQESEILRHLTAWKELEPLAEKCTKVYVWHTRTEAPKLSFEQQLRKKGQRSDEGMEV